jgi:hypothetical protein
MLYFGPRLAKKGRTQGRTAKHSRLKRQIPPPDDNVTNESGSRRKLYAKAGKQTCFSN